MADKITRLAAHSGRTIEIERRRDGTVASVRVIDPADEEKKDG